MFDLEKSIEEWRGKMLAAGVKSPVPLEELESHLREDIEQQMRAGSDAAIAFENALDEMGNPKMLKNEFSKNERKLMRRTLIVLAAILDVPFGIAFILPACAWYRVHGEMPAEQLEFLLLGIAIIVTGLSVLFFNLKKRKA